MPADRIVIDSGYLLESILPTKPAWQNEADELIERLAERDIQGCVPWLFFAEIANVCYRKTQGKAIARKEAEYFLETVQNLGLDVDIQMDWPLQLFENAMSLQIQAYDRIYIDLSERMGGLPIASRDGGMLAGARALRLPVFRP